MKKIDVKQSYIDLVKECGKDNTLYTFEYCSNFGIELDNSTIDEISIAGDDVMFVYNANVQGEWDYLEHFSMDSLIGFYNGLIDAIKEEENED